MQNIDEKTSVRAYKLGELTILGVDEDFRESPVPVLVTNYEEKKEMGLKRARRRRAKRPIDPLRNRFDRMKSYYFKTGLDWRLDWDDFCRLWESAPMIYDPERGETVPAREYADRKGKIRLCRDRVSDKYLDVSNARLQLRGKLFHKLKL